MKCSHKAHYNICVLLSGIFIVPMRKSSCVSGAKSDKFCGKCNLDSCSLSNLCRDVFITFFWNIPERKFTSSSVRFSETRFRIRTQGLRAAKTQIKSLSSSIFLLSVRFFST